MREPKQYIEEKNGGLYIIGKRVSLASVVYQFRDGETPECIRSQFSVLTLEEVYGAITYALAHPDEVDAYLARLEAIWQENRPVEPTLSPGKAPVHTTAVVAERELGVENAIQFGAAVDEREGWLYVAGTRVSLASIAHQFREGFGAECIRSHFPSLTLQQVYGAIAYILANPAYVESYLARLDALWEEVMQTTPSVWDSRPSRSENADSVLRAQESR